MKNSSGQGENPDRWYSPRAKDFLVKGAGQAKSTLDVPAWQPFLQDPRHDSVKLRSRQYSLDERRGEKERRRADLFTRNLQVVRLCIAFAGTLDLLMLLSAYAFPDLFRIAKMLWNIFRVPELFFEAVFF